MTTHAIDIEEFAIAIGPILEAARSAPSGDNMQPVRFSVAPDTRSIGLYIDRARDPSPMNAGQRMARMAAGASLENLIREATSRGLAVEIRPGLDTILAEVRLSGDPIGPADPAGSRPGRVTNRRPYDGKPVDPGSLRRLAESCPPIDGATTHWIAEPIRVAAFADLIGQADAMMFGEPTMRRAFLGSVRFDIPPAREADEGLPLDSLEIGAAERVALRSMRRMPDWLLKVGGAARIFAQKARALVGSASGLCLVVAPDGSEAADVAVGRALQRSWLALAAEGLATQPMMSPLVLENAAEHGEDALKAALGPDKLRRLRDDFRAIAPEIGDRRPAWLLRFGHAQAPSGRTGRLPLATLTDRAGPADG